MPVKTSTEQDYQQRIVRTLVYIQEHLDDALELEQVAAVAAFSQYHFHRVFRGLVGESLKTYIRRLRLERAARDLKHLGDPITQLAFAAGFENHESFTRAFGEMFGTSPSAYRQAHKPPPQSPSGTHFEDTAGFHFADPHRPPVKIKDLPRMRLLFLRHVGPYAEVSRAWGRLMSWAGMRGLFGPAMQMIGIVHDDPEITPQDKIRYDAAITVDRKVEPEGEFGAVEFAASKYAVLEHRGPYEAMDAAYRQLYGGWLPRSGYELADAPAFELYLNSPQMARPEDLRTLIHVPLA